MTVIETIEEMCSRERRHGFALGLAAGIVSGLIVGSVAFAWLR